MLHDADACPQQLVEQLPLRAQVVRALPGPDRADYCLAVAHEPVRFAITEQQLAATGMVRTRLDPTMYRASDDGLLHGIAFGLVLCARLDGEMVNPAMRHMQVNLAFVMDQSQMRDPALAFDKILPVGSVQVTMANLWP